MKIFEVESVINTSVSGYTINDVSNKKYFFNINNAELYLKKLESAVLVLSIKDKFDIKINELEIE